MTVYRMDFEPGTSSVPNFPPYSRDELLTRKGERFCKRFGLVPRDGRFTIDARPIPITQEASR